MVQFVPSWERTPPYPTATSIQKCIRTPDIDEVGINPPATRFFRWPSNFSFGDYFQTRAIELAQHADQQPAAGGYGLDLKESGRQSISTTTKPLWQEVAGLPAERTSAAAWPTTTGRWAFPDRAGLHRRFITTADPTGPAGGPIVSEDRYLEVWNPVSCRTSGRGEHWEDYQILGPLPGKNIDTGMGKKRTALVPRRAQRLRDRPAQAGHYRGQGRRACLRRRQPRRRRGTASSQTTTAPPRSDR